MVELLHDVVIVGAGPAGSTTALRLARAGFSVALVDARRFPRFKACGEFMSPEVLPMLDELGLRAELEAHGVREVRGMVLHGHGKRVSGRFVDVGRAHAPFDYGWAVRREVFDEVLLRAAQRAGARVYEGWRVEELLRGADGEVVGVLAHQPGGAPIRLRARWTIGADGTRSAVATALGVRKESSWLRKLALTTRYEGVDWGDLAEVHFLEHGFFACAPIDGGAVSLNLVLDRAEYERERLGRDELLETWLARTPQLGERLARGRRIDPVRGTGSMAMTTSAQVQDGVALVGDAAGYVDPVTGEGIFFAIKGAQMLASALEPALHDYRTDAGSLASYLAGRKREIAPRAAVSTLLQRGLRHPRLVSAAFRLLAGRPRLVDTIVSVAGDYVPTRELLRPKVWVDALALGRKPA